jgi:hypothetical protein
MQTALSFVVCRCMINARVEYSRRAWIFHCTCSTTTWRDPQYIGEVAMAGMLNVHITGCTFHAFTSHLHACAVMAFVVGWFSWPTSWVTCVGSGVRALCNRKSLTVPRELTACVNVQSHNTPAIQRFGYEWLVHCAFASALESSLWFSGLLV